MITFRSNVTNEKVGIRPGTPGKISRKPLVNFEKHNTLIPSGCQLEGIFF